MKGYDQCVRLMQEYHRNNGLSGIHRVPPKGIRVVRDKLTMAQLKAYHITGKGKDVDFSSLALIKFLNELAAMGYNRESTFEDVEYVFSEFTGLTTGSNGLPCFSLASGS
jgi:hypothetical protein